MTTPQERIREKAERLIYVLPLATTFDNRDQIEAALLATRNEALEEACDSIRQPCPYRPEPCGDCRHCHLTKAAIRIRALKTDK